MNIHLDLWLIYLINLLPAIDQFLSLITGLLFIATIFHLCMYIFTREKLTEIYQDFDKQRTDSITGGELSQKISSIQKKIIALDRETDFMPQIKKDVRKEVIEKRIADQIIVREEAYKRCLIFMTIAIFCLCVGVFIPNKKDAIQLVKVNYINQSNMVLNDNSIDALSQNIDTILNPK